MEEVYRIVSICRVVGYSKRYHIKTEMGISRHIDFIYNEGGKNVCGDFIYYDYEFCKWVNITALDRVRVVEKSTKNIFKKTLDIIKSLW